MPTIGMNLIVHEMVFAGSGVGALDGVEYYLCECLDCGLLEKWMDGEPTVLRAGSGDITPEDAIRYAAASTPAEKLQVSRELARVPSHTYAHVDKDGTRQLAVELGREDEYLDAMGDQPLVLRFT